MHKFLFFPLFFISFSGIAQIKISGKVTDTKRSPLQGISVSLVGSYDGATTDSLGNFLFNTSEKSEQVLKATASGYKDFEQKINIAAEPIIVKIELKESITELKAVVISAGTFEASDAKRATALNPIDIVTTASANGDITSAIKTLPGTQQVGESEGLFVRGGTASETKIFQTKKHQTRLPRCKESQGQATRLAMRSCWHRASQSLWQQGSVRITLQQTYQSTISNQQQVNTHFIFKYVSATRS